MTSSTLNTSDFPLPPPRKEDDEDDSEGQCLVSSSDEGVLSASSTDEEAVLRLHIISRHFFTGNSQLKPKNIKENVKEDMVIVVVARLGNGCSTQLFHAGKTVELSDRWIIVFEEPWVSHLFAFMRYDDILQMSGFEVVEISALQERLLINFNAVQTEYSVVYRKVLSFSSSSIGGKLKVYRRGFPQSPAEILWDSVCGSSPPKRLPEWASLCVKEASKRPKQSEEARRASESLSGSVEGSNQVVYTPLNELYYDDIEYNLYGVVWESLTSVRYSGSMYFMNLMLVDDSMKISPTHFSSTEIVRYSLQLPDSLSPGKIPVLTAGDVVRVLNIRIKRSKNRFIDLNPNQSTSIAIWSGDRSLPVDMASCRIHGKGTNRVFDEVKDRGRIIQLQEWFYRITRTQSTYVNFYTTSLSDIPQEPGNAERMWKDLIVKIVSIRLKNDSISTNEEDSSLTAKKGNFGGLSTLQLVVSDGSCSELGTISGFSKYMANHLVDNWPHFKIGDWVRVRNVFMKQSAQASTLYSQTDDDGVVHPVTIAFESISDAPEKLLLTKLPFWCKDVADRQRNMLTHFPRCKDYMTIVKSPYVTRRVQCNIYTLEQFQVLLKTLSQSSILEAKRDVYTVESLEFCGFKAVNGVDIQQPHSWITQLKDDITQSSFDLWFLFRDEGGRMLEIHYLDDTGWLFGYVSSSECLENEECLKIVSELVKGLFCGDEEGTLQAKKAAEGSASPSDNALPSHTQIDTHALEIPVYVHKPSFTISWRGGSPVFRFFASRICLKEA